MRRTNVYLDEDQLRILKHVAVDNGHSVADLVRNAVDTYLAQAIANGAIWSERFNQSAERICRRVEVSQQGGATIVTEGGSPLQNVRQSPAKRSRLKAQTFTPRPMLQREIETVLRKYGGRARTQYVIDRVGENLVEKLTTADQGTDKAGEVVWRKNVRFARQDMVAEGGLKRDSPHGWWELPDR